MPKRNTEEYEDDGGFVEDAPKSKSSKKQKRSVANSEAIDSESVPGGGHASSTGEYWELSGKRRIQVSTYNGKEMINIREYYEKDGEMLPGKKGISLTLEQYDTVVTLLPHIETVLKSKGHVVKRPDYEGTSGEAEEELDDEEELEDANDEDEDDEEPAKRIKKKPSGDKKKNFDDTSDDD